MAIEAMIVAGKLPRKAKIDQHDQADGEHQLELDVADRGADARSCGRRACGP